MTFESVGTMHLFAAKLNNSDDWHDIKRSVPAFAPLIHGMMRKENLPLAAVECAMPGTNAVFKAGKYVVKIFVPPELASHGGYGTDFSVELFGMKWANKLGVPSPNLVASGMMADKYAFRYMIMDYMQGEPLDKIEHKLSYEDKVKIGRNVRYMTTLLNVPCDNFTPIDIMQYAMSNEEWEQEGFPAPFLTELSEYLNHFHMGQKVYCHGDIHEGNIIVDDNMHVALIDFADAMYAPTEYEWVYIVSSLFGFEKPYMEGFFAAKYSIDDVLALCMKWLPVHAWSHGLLAEMIGPAEDITSFAVMRERLRNWIESEKRK